MKKFYIIVIALGLCAVSDISFAEPKTTLDEKTTGFGTTNC